MNILKVEKRKLTFCVLLLSSHMKGFGRAGMKFNQGG